MEETTEYRLRITFLGEKSAVPTVWREDISALEAAADFWKKLPDVSYLAIESRIIMAGPVIEYIDRPVRKD